VYEATILPPSGRRVSERMPIEAPNSRFGALGEWPPAALAGLGAAALVVIVAFLLIVGVL
jgi:hypothetical protein